MKYLKPGQNISLSSLETAAPEALRLALTWDPGPSELDLDVSALLLGEDGRVAADSDMVFYNQPSGGEESVLHLGKSPTETGSEDRVLLRLAQVPASVSSVVLAASVDGGTFGDLGGVGLCVSDLEGERLIAFDAPPASTETAFVLGEVYRRNGEWKVRAIGQGYDSGLAGLAVDFGVQVEDEPVAGDSTDVQGPVSDQLEAAPEEVAPAEDSATATAPDATPQERGTPARSSPRRRAVQTIKRKPYSPPQPALAESPLWHLAPLFPVDGITSRDEQERRVRSILLATMMGVKEFGRAVVARLGGPVGSIEAYQEVPFEHGETTVYPDGVIRVARGGKVWTALVEVKTGTSILEKTQVESYLEVAREHGYDAVVTISNEIPTSAGIHPVKLDGRRNRKTALLHLSWSEVLTEALVSLAHRGVSDATQAWVLSEFVAYLRNPKTGTAGFDDMGPAWVAVRDAVAAGTLRSKDPRAAQVAQSWNRLIRHLCLRLTGELGTEVVVTGQRKLRGDVTAQLNAQVERLALEGVLESTLKVPGAVAPVCVHADLRTGRVDVSIQFPAPQEGKALTRVNWLLRQLPEAPADLRVIASSAEDEARELLGVVRSDPKKLAAQGDPLSFELGHSSPLGTKRSVGRGGFITSVNQAFDGFYSTTVEGLRAWVPPAPKLSTSAEDEPEAVVEP